MKTKLFITLSLLFSYTFMTAQNPFFSYQNWNTPHGTFPFNDIKAEHYKIGRAHV